MAVPATVAPASNWPIPVAPVVQIALTATTNTEVAAVVGLQATERDPGAVIRVEAQAAVGGRVGTAVLAEAGRLATRAAVRGSMAPFPAAVAVADPLAILPTISV